MNLAEVIRRRGPVWVVAHTSLWLFDRFFEFVLYPVAIIELGLLLGTATMMVLSFFICLLLIWIYDTVSLRWVRDVLGFETLKEVGREARERAGRWLGSRNPGDRGLRTYRLFLFTYLSVVFDPMTCLVLLRPAGLHRMGAAEWRVFLGSVLVSNAVWGVIVWLGVEAVMEVFPALAERFG